MKNVEINMIVSKGDVVKTFLAKTNINGNRNTIIVNYSTEEYVVKGCWLGNFGTTKEKMLQRDLKDIEKRLIATNFTRKQGTVKYRR